MKNLSRKILDIIEEEQIEPRPRWVFLAQDISIWLLITASVLFGAAALGVLFYALTETDFALLSHFGRSWTETLLFLTPLFWLFSFTLFLIFSFLFWRRTKRGYRIPWLYVVAVNLLLTGALGAAFYLTGGGMRLEQVVDEHIPVYRGIHKQRVQVWNRPESGFLAGEVLETTGSTFTLSDFYDNRWQIAIENAILPPGYAVSPGDTVRMRGNITGEGEFSAESLMPWIGRGKEENIRDFLREKRRQLPWHEHGEPFSPPLLERRR